MARTALHPGLARRLVVCFVPFLSVCLLHRHEHTHGGLVRPEWSVEGSAVPFHFALPIATATSGRQAHWVIPITPPWAIPNLSTHKHTSHPFPCGVAAQGA
eukprot:1154608-Pelagomonas_calceolata.AAC.1